MSVVLFSSFRTEATDQSTASSVDSHSLPSHVAVARKFQFKNNALLKLAEKNTLLKIYNTRL